MLLGERISEENAKVIRRNENIHSVIWGEGVKLYILSPSNSNIEFIYNEYEVGSSTGGKLYQHEGEECAYVIEGKLEIDLNGKKIILNNGDFIWFLSTIPHKIKNLSDKKSIAIWVDSPPRF